MRVTRLLVAAAFCALLTGTAAAQGTWTSRPAPLERSEVGVVEIGGKIYVVGGGVNRPGDQLEYASPLLQEYDPATDKWRDLAPMPHGANHISAAALNGKLYAAGGFIGPGEARAHRNPIDFFHVYDPATNRWETLAPLSSPRGSVGLAAVAGKIHAIGGRDGEGRTVGTHEVYDPATGKWTEAAPLPIARDHLGIVVVDGRIHIVGGRNSFQGNRTMSSGINLALHDIFDPATGQWTSSEPLPAPRSSGAGAAYRGLVLYAGGECKDPATKTAFYENEAFDPKTGKWMTLARLPEGLHAFSAVSVGDSLYLFGGMHGCFGSGGWSGVQIFKLP